MEQLEEAQAALGELEQHVAGSDERLAELGELRDRKQREIDAELEQLAADRAPAAN